MATNELTSFLLNASSNDKAVRDVAEDGLRQAQETNWPYFVTQLAQELASDDKGDQTRQMAGLILKNLLDAKDSGLKDEKFAKWKALDGGTKAQIREMVLRTLASKSHAAAHGAAMVIAKVAHIELLAGDWPDLLQRLQSFMSADQSDALRVFTLQCLGYVCEEHKAEASQFPQAETNKMLTSIVQGMAGNQNTEVRLAATRALADAVEFAALNFEKKEERDYLMQMICEATISPDARVRLASYQCLVKVADIHYQYLEAYIQTIYQLTTQSFKDAEEEVAMQAVEFWTTVADVEIELGEMEDQTTGDSENECKHYLKKACGSLVPLLLELLTKQSEDQDEDDNEWNVCMSAAVCIASTAQAVGDDIVPITVAYVKENVSKNRTPEDWRWREAAMTAFGSIVEGPRREAIMPFVQEAFDYLVTQGLQDSNGMVKRTTAWTIGRIFEFLHDGNKSPPIVTAANAESLVAALLRALQDGPAMAERACYAIQQLARGFSPELQSHELTPHFVRLVEALMTVAYAEVPMEVAHKLHISAFEAINSVIQFAGTDSMQFVCEMVPHIIQRIGATFNIREEHLQQRKHELQGQLCAALQVTIRRMDAHPPSKEVLLQNADRVMESLIAIQNTRQSVSEEVMLTVSALCLAQGAEFAKYMQFITMPLLMGLARHQEYQVCRVCVNALGDIAREIKHQLLPYSDVIMRQLLENLQNPQLHRDVKPDILSVFGDIAQGLEQHFDKYLGQVVETLQAAMSIAYSNQQVYQQDDDPDESLINYNNDLELGIINACAGILSGVPDDPSQIPSATAQLLLPFGKNILTFLHFVHQDYEFAEDSVNKEGVALLGDVCRIPGMNTTIAQPSVLEWSQTFLNSCRDIAPTAVGYTEQQIRLLVGSLPNSS